MDYLGNRNLFTSEFIIGCELPINEEFEFVKALHHWLKFKDNDREMRYFRSERTQYIAFLHIIELKVFKEILNDLVIIYKKSYPFGEKRDFIKHAFSSTLYALENIIDWNFTYYFSPPPGIAYEICYYFEDKFKYPIIDFLLESPKDIDYYKQYYKKIVELINNLDFYNIDSKILIPQELTETKAKAESPKTFEELFYNVDFVTSCINMLKDIQPPLIDAECNYIGQSKGAFCVWIDEMQRQGIIKHFSDRKLFAALLPQKIKRFSIDESMFGKTQSRAETQYRMEFKTRISQIKLSQDSQKGKLGK